VEVRESQCSGIALLIVKTRLWQSTLPRNAV
jgi:hypothetical protein